MKNLKRISAFLFAVLFALAGSGIASPVQAAESDQTGSITVNFDGNSDVTFRLYQVASYDEDNGYTFVGDFKDLSVDLTDKTAAATLEQYVNSKSFEAMATEKTDTDGKVVFDNLEKGGYLILGEDFKKDGYQYTENPIFVSIPSEVEDESGLVYDMTIDANTKYSKKEISSGETSIKAVKVWSDSNNSYKKRPSSVKVQLYQDGNLYEEQTLSSSNDWTYSWKNLDASSKWTITEEDVPDNYTVSITKQSDGKTYVITNTYKKTTTTSKKSSSGSSSSSSTLPQTGQLWWPVGIMLCAGLLFIIIGLKINRRKD